MVIPFDSINNTLFLFPNCKRQTNHLEDCCICFNSSLQFGLVNANECLFGAFLFDEMSCQSFRSCSHSLLLFFCMAHDPLDSPLLLLLPPPTFLAFQAHTSFFGMTMWKGHSCTFYWPHRQTNNSAFSVLLYWVLFSCCCRLSIALQAFELQKSMNRTNDTFLSVGVERTNGRTDGLKEGRPCLKWKQNVGEQQQKQYFSCYNQFTGGIWSNSLAIATDAAHLLTDFASFMISLFAIWIAGRPSTQR